MHSYANLICSCYIAQYYVLSMHSYANLICSCYIAQYYVLCMYSYANLICSCYIAQYYVLCMYSYANPLICKTLYIKVYNKNIIPKNRKEYNVKNKETK